MAIMNIVPRVSTPKSLEAIADELREAYAAATGRPLNATTAELLTAQILIETNNGQGIKNNAPGNITASHSWPGDAWRPPWFDPPTEATSARNRELHDAMHVGKAPQAFRAFDSFDKGMRNYVDTLQRQFPTILAARTPGELAHAIYHSGYTRDHKPEAIEPTLAQHVETVRKAGVFDDLAAASTETQPPKAEPAPVSSGSRPAPRSYRFVQPSVLERGSSGPLVVLWQRFVGADDDGLFGADTESATRAWQSRNGLPADGRVSVPCWVVATVGAVVPARWNQ